VQTCELLIKFKEDKAMKIRQSWVTLAIEVLVILLACGAGWASINRGSIRGTVTDPQGAVMSAVGITITNLDTGVQQTTQTNGSGFYFVPELVPGTYRVHFEKSGFIAVDVSNIVVEPNDVATVDQNLNIGRAVQSVHVVAATPLVDTTASNFSIAINQHYLQDMPLNGHDIQSLVQLMPGVTQSNGPPGSLVSLNGGADGGFPDPRHIIGGLISVNGSQASGNAWYLDGSLNAAEGMDNTVVDPAPDAVAEFQAVNNSFAAEYGRGAGAVFNVVLKSGTNNVHGDLYSYNRNSYFEARNPFSPTSPSGQVLPPNFVNWNQFGGTFGGPVVIPKIYNGKGRTFFFVGWDVSLLHENGSTLQSIPTLLERQGNFSEIPSVRQYGIYDPLTTVYSSSLGTFTRQPFLNPDGSLATSLPAQRLDPFASYMMNQFPAPNYLDPRQQNPAAGGCLNTCNNFEGTYGSGQTTNNVVAKVDYQVSERHKLFAEYLDNPSSYKFIREPWTGPTAPYLGFNGAEPWKVTSQLATLGSTITFSPSLLNEARLSYSRQGITPQALPASLAGYQGELQKLQGLGIPTLPGTIEAVPCILTGVILGPCNGDNRVEITEALTFQDSITKVLSKHTLKMGFMFRDDQTSTIFFPGTFLEFFRGLTDNPVTGQGGRPLAEFLLGAANQGSFVGGAFGTFGPNHTWSGYFQDDYRVTPNFTLNFGLRYDVYGWFADRHNNASIFDFNMPNPDVPTRLGGIAYFGTSAHPGNVAFPANKNDFAPRVNFTYSPFKDEKTVIRGGFDVVHTNGITQIIGQGTGASEDPGYNQHEFWETDATGQGLVGEGVTPAFTLSSGAPTPFPLFGDPKITNQQLLGPTGGILTQVPFSHDPYMMMWNLQVQRALPGDMMVSAGYVGNRGNHLVSGANYTYNHVSTNDELQYKSQLRQLVPMPPDLAPIWGSQYFMSQLFSPYPEYSYVDNFLSDDAWSTYHAFQLKVERRFSHGFNFLVAYTFQKTIGSPGLGAFLPNGSESGLNNRLSGLPGGYGYAPSQNPDNMRGDKTLAVDDIPNIFNVGSTYELPFGPGKLLGSGVKGVQRLLIQGWKISGNFNAQNGVPMEITGPANGLTSRVNLTGNPNAGRSSKTRYQEEQQWYNPNAFEAAFGSDPATIALATTGTPAQKDSWVVNGSYPFWRFGTAGERLGNARAPGFWGADMALTKDFKFSETKNLQLHVEMYNAFNHQNLGLPSTGWCLPPNPDGSTDAVHQFGCSFGRITSIQTDPRSVQFGLKFMF
jgi:hypothetical protein